MMHPLGIDVSKAKLDVALLKADGKYRCKVFANDAAGFASLLLWLRSHVPKDHADVQADVHVCLEATGSYHQALALFLTDQGVSVSVVNPLLVKRFMEVERVRNKTDMGDAKSLARFCRATEPELWQAPSLGVRALQALVLRLDTLQEMRQSEINRLQVAHASVQQSLRDVIAGLDSSIKDVQTQIGQTMDDDPDLRERRSLLQSIPGLGARSIPQLLAYIGRPQRFKSVKALVAYAALAPLIRQSGSSLNKNTGTHPQGHRDLRRALYFPAMVAGQHNPLVAAFWQRLKAQNKPGKVIVVACMHKLLAIAYGVLKSGKPFNPDYLKPMTA
jgi:transposase